MTTSKTVARDAQRNRRRELEEGVNGIRREERASLFSTAAERWLAVGKGKRGEWAANAVTLHNLCLSHLKPFFGGKLIFNIEPGDIETYQPARKREVPAGAPSTWKRARCVKYSSGINAGRVLREISSRRRSAKCWSRTLRRRGKESTQGGCQSQISQKRVISDYSGRTKYGDASG